MWYFIYIFISYFLFVPILFSEISNGFILYSNSQGIGPSSTYIINNNYNNVNTWFHSIGAIGIPIETFKPQPALLHAEILKK